MARIRTIKPEFPQSESMGRVSRDARLMFVLLWTLADDEGRLRAHPRLLAGALFPYDDDAYDVVVASLYELSEEGCLMLYSDEAGQYAQITNWSAHQRIDRPTPSRFPEPPGYKTSREPSSNPREPSRALVVGKEGKGKERKGQEVECVPPPKADAEAYARTIGLPPTEFDYWWLYQEARDWQIKGKQIENWKLAMQTWLRKVPPEQREVAKPARRPA